MGAGYQLELAVSVAVSSENRGQCPAKVVRFGSSLIEENSLTRPAVTVRTPGLKLLIILSILNPDITVHLNGLQNLDKKIFKTRKYLTIAKTGQESDRHFGNHETGRR